MIGSGVDLDLLLPPFVAGLAVLASHVPLGRQVLRRGIVFIDLAIAQIAGLGVIAAHVLGWEAAGWPVQVAALAAALTAATVFHATDRLWPGQQEALIGSAFIVAASAGVLLLAGDPHAGEQLKDLLIGQILWVDYPRIVPMAVLGAALLLSWRRLDLAARPLAFYLALAVVVTASVQLVGIYLVFASLILPALATQNRPGPGGLAWGYAIGGGGYGLGLTLSAYLDWPAAPGIVVAIAGVALVFALGQRRQSGLH